MRPFRALAALLAVLYLPLHAENDQHFEDQVAALFMQLRAEAGLPKLTRIEHSRELEQLACTAAAEEGRRRIEYSYKTSDPTIATAELRRYAAGPPYHGDWATTRFAVAVWPARRSANEPQQYWVVVKKCFSPLGAFIDYTVTDDIGHQNDWKKAVSPACKRVQ